jgi:hypothetical protein
MVFDPAVGSESDCDFAMLISGSAAVNVLSASGGLHDVLDRYRYRLDTMPLELC